MGYEIGTGNEQEILQRRRLQAELGLEPFHPSGLSVNLPRVIRFWDAGEGQVLLDQDETPIGFPFMTGKGRSK